MAKVDVFIKSFKEQADILYKKIDGLSDDQMNWKLVIPLGDDYWSVRQILAHIVEVNHFWVSQFKQLANDRNAPVGRSEKDYKDRLEAVANADKWERADLIDALRKSVDEACADLSGLSDEVVDLTVPIEGHQAPLAFLIKHVYPDHIEDHLKHIDRQLFAYSQYH